MFSKLLIWLMSCLLVVVWESIICWAFDCDQMNSQFLTEKLQVKIFANAKGARSCNALFFKTSYHATVWSSITSSYCTGTKLLGMGTWGPFQQRIIKDDPIRSLDICKWGSKNKVSPPGNYSCIELLSQYFSSRHWTTETMCLISSPASLLWITPVNIFSEFDQPNKIKWIV